MSYTGISGKLIECKKIGPSCQCSNRCFEKIGENVKKIFTTFWQMGDYSTQNAYIAGCVKISTPKRHYKRDGQSRKGFSMAYYVCNNGVDMKICKTAFISMHGISNGRLSRTLEKKKKDGNSGLDQRGQHKNRPNKIDEELITRVKEHIESFPTQTSHYSRSCNPKRKYLSSELNITRMYLMYKENEIEANREPVKEWFYRNIFNFHFNLSFGTPKTDTCKLCDSLQIKIEAATSEEDKKRNIDAKEVHLRKVDAAKTALDSDIENAKNDSTSIIICMDLQQALPTPKLETSIVFYKRQLWTYNFCIHDMVTNASYMFLWSEDTAKRGSEEIMSCVFKFVSTLPASVRNLIIYSDSCCGQNKNFGAVVFWLFLIHTGRFDTIQHKFLVSGHTFMACDRDFGLIEQEKKRRQNIYTPQQYVDVVLKSRRKQPFLTYLMNSGDFYSLTNLIQKVTKRVVTISGNKLDFRKLMVMSFSKDKPLSYQVKWNHTNLDTWEEVDIHKKSKGRRSLNNPDMIFANQVLENKYNGKVPITKGKKKDLNDLLCFIPPVYHEFYNNLEFLPGEGDAVQQENDDDSDDDFYDY